MLTAAPNVIETVHDRPECQPGAQIGQPDIRLGGLDISSAIWAAASSAWNDVSEPSVPTTTVWYSPVRVPFPILTNAGFTSTLEAIALPFAFSGDSRPAGER